MHVASIRKIAEASGEPKSYVQYVCARELLRDLPNPMRAKDGSYVSGGNAQIGSPTANADATPWFPLTVVVLLEKMYRVPADSEGLQGGIVGIGRYVSLSVGKYERRIKSFVGRAGRDLGQRLPKISLGELT